MGLTGPGNNCEGDMCGGCVKTEYPTRGNTCLENGSYLLNYVACIECKQRDFVMITNRAIEEEDGEEIITYDHVCKNCHHVIARHEYTFSVVDDYQGEIECFHTSKQEKRPQFGHTIHFKMLVQNKPELIHDLIMDEGADLEYTMLCMLCGRAEDSISVLPDDPHLMTPLF